NTRLSPDETRGGIDADALHCREVDEQAAFADAVTGEAVAAARHPPRQSIPPREVYRAGNVGRPGTTGDQSRLPIEHAVPQLASRVVGLIAGAQQRAAQA